MAYETLPGWFWIISYSLLFLALVTAVYSLFKKKEKWLATSVVLTTFLLPFVSLLYFIGRPEGKNELEYLIDELQKVAPLSILIVAGYILILYWFIHLFTNKGNRQRSEKM
ncbi:hypothetical protein ACFDTO_32710 [Microbacteriaceae bacterium 4G12]